MTESGLLESQMAMVRFLRDPAAQPPPAGIEPRRLKIYQDLIYNNIEGFISSGFPVLRSLYEEGDWHSLVRLFIDQHRCHTPYFLEISQEFLHFLDGVHQLRDCDPPFINELAHYEWVELALDVAEEELPAQVDVDNVQLVVPKLSPLAWSLSYQYPVHLIGPGFRPEQPPAPTFIVVYRNREDAVCFMEINAAVARLLELVRDNEAQNVQELLQVLAQEMGVELSAILEFGGGQIQQFIKVGVVLA